MSKRVLTVAQAANAGRCSTPLIRRLCRSGAIKSERAGREYRVLDSRELVRDIVARESPKSGYRKRARGGSVRRRPEPVPLEPEKNGSAGLGPVFEWVAIPSEKRSVLLKLAQKYSTDNLDLLLSL